MEFVLDEGPQGGPHRPGRYRQSEPRAEKGRGGGLPGGKGFLVIPPGDAGRAPGDAHAPGAPGGGRGRSGPRRLRRLPDRGHPIRLLHRIYLLPGHPEGPGGPPGLPSAALGDSLVLVDDDEIIKVHVHTNHPGKVLEEALTYGALQTVKIENMRSQHTELLEEARPGGRCARPPRAGRTGEKSMASSSVCAGEGIAAVFRDLGVDRIVSGGQTMNPSTQDIMGEIDRTPAEIVYVLPNNKNIIMAAEQCIPLAQGKTVVVLPTKTIPKGVSALLSFDPDASQEDNTQAHDPGHGAGPYLPDYLRRREFRLRRLRDPGGGLPGPQREPALRHRPGHLRSPGPSGQEEHQQKPSSSPSITARTSPAPRPRPPRRSSPPPAPRRYHPYRRGPAGVLLPHRRRVSGRKPPPFCAQWKKFASLSKKAERLFRQAGGFYALGR